jgi:hypothetical protein
LKPQLESLADATQIPHGHLSPLSGHIYRPCTKHAP